MCELIRSVNLRVLCSLCAAISDSSIYLFAVCRGARSEKRSRAHLATQPCTDSSPPLGNLVASNTTVAYKNYSCARENVMAASKQASRAALTPVVLNSALSIAVTSVKPVAAMRIACSPLGSAAAATHRYRVQAPQGRTKASRGRANSLCTRQ